MTSTMASGPTSTLPSPQRAPETSVAPEPLQLSFSRVDSYRTCSLKYRFAYVDHLPSTPGPELSWGSSIHAALERWWDQKLPQPPPVDDLLQALYEGWDDEGFDGMKREEKLRWYRHAQDVLRRHHARYSPNYLPAVATEQWFEVAVGDAITVVGSIDHVARTSSGGFGIVDWKTNRKARPRRYVEGSLQLAIYTLAAKQLWGAEPEWVALDFVVPGVRVTVERAQIDTEGALQAIREVAADIRAERFSPKPSALCGWCDWRTLCPAFDGDGPDVAGTAVVELHKLRRRQQRDAERIATLERIVAGRLGEAAGRTGEAGTGR